MDFTFNIWSYVLGVIFGLLCNFLMLYWKQRPKRYVIQNTQAWLPIDKFPIPDDFDREQEFLVTDGKVISTMINPFYNSKGQAFFSYRRIITHWQPMPELPKE